MTFLHGTEASQVHFAGVDSLIKYCESIGNDLGDGDDIPSYGRETINLDTGTAVVRRQAKVEQVRGEVRVVHAGIERIRLDDRNGRGEL